MLSRLGNKRHKIHARWQWPRAKAKYGIKTQGPTYVTEAVLWSFGAGGAAGCRLRYWSLAAGAAASAWCCIATARFGCCVLVTLHESGDDIDNKSTLKKQKFVAISDILTRTNKLQEHNLLGNPLRNC